MVPHLISSQIALCPSASSARHHYWFAFKVMPFGLTTCHADPVKELVSSPPPHPPPPTHTTTTTTSVVILAQVIHAEGGLSSSATADHLQVHSCSFTVCTASCLLNMLVFRWRSVQVLSCFGSCAVLPFLVRIWSGLALAYGIKSPSTSMSSPYSQSAHWGARVMPKVPLPWTLPSRAPSLPSFTTPSSQTSLVTQAALSLPLLQPCTDFVQMLPVMGPVQILGTWTKVFCVALSLP